MLKILSTCILLCAMLPCKAQYMSRISADSLKLIIRENKEDKETVLAMVQLSQFYILKSNSNKADLDSSKQLIEQSKVMNAKLRSREIEGFIWLQQSNLHKKKGDMLTGKEQALKAVALLQKEHNTLLLGKAWLALADFYSYQVQGDIKKRIVVVENALYCFEKVGDNERQAYCLEVLTDLSDTSLADFPRVLQLGKRSLEKYKTVQNANQAGILVIIANLYMERKDYPTALTYCIRALRNIAEIHDSSTLECQINSTTGIIYNELHEYNLAAVHMEKALFVAEKFHDTPAVRLVGPNLADIYFNLHHSSRALEVMNHIVANFGKPSSKSQLMRYLALYLNANTDLHNYNKAQFYCDSMLTFADLPGLTDGRKLFVYSQAEQFYILTKQYDKARRLFPKFKVSIIMGLSQAAQIKGYDLAFRLDTAEHLYQAAVGELLQKDLIKDSMYTSARNKQVQQLSAEYETYKKEKDIQLLQNEGLLQRRELQQSRLVKNFFLGGVLLLLGLLALAVSRYRLKQRNNLQLESRQKEITAKNSQLQKLLQENEWLLKEVHHRVKNNLQVVMSLLNTQSSYLKDEEAVNAIMQSKNRVQAMSLIHQKLYKTDNVSAINMAEYIRELVDHLKDYANPALHILFTLDIADVELDVMEAVPVGLILNEAITNSCKYAFQQGHESIITVSLQPSGKNRLRLCISDNGIGLPPDYKLKQGTSFGMLLIEGMVEDLGGTLEMANETGVAYNITFTYVMPVERRLSIA